MRLHDTSQVETPDQHPLSDLEQRQKRQKSSSAEKSPPSVLSVNEGVVVPISWDQMAKKDFDHLAVTITNVLHGLQGMDTFRSHLAACSEVLKTRPGMCKMFDL